MDDNAFFIILVLILIIVGFYIYMLPTFVAYNRRHPQRFWIMMLNLFLGGTLVGWISALIWAHGGENKND
jgi:H+/Cl- antiporter ClcA